MQYLSKNKTKSEEKIVQTDFNDPRDNLVDIHAFKNTGQKHVEVSSVVDSKEIRSLLDKLILGPIVSQNRTSRLNRRNQLHGRRFKKYQAGANKP